MIRIDGVDYWTVEEFCVAKGWIQRKSAYKKLQAGRIPGARKLKSGQWLIPVLTILPDGRVRHGRYIGERSRRRKIRFDE